MKTGELKKQARRRLTDYWVQAIVTVLILLAVYVASTFLQASAGYLMQLAGILTESDFGLFSTNPYMIILNAAGTVLSFFVMAPIYMGVVWWYIHCVRGEENRISDIFVCFSNARSYFKVILIKFAAFGLQLLMMLPGIVCAYLEYSFWQHILTFGYVSGSRIAILVLGGIFTLCVLLLGAVATLRLALVDYLYVINPDLKVRQLISISAKKMRSKTKGAILLALSFLPWLPLAIFVFPLFFILPYFGMTYTVFMNEAMNEAVNN